MSLPQKPRKMRPIPISAAEQIAKDYGYDQVVIMARRVGADPDPFGEHITTYGINKVHCDVAALMGDTLKDIAQWPEREDFNKARALLDDLESGAFTYSDYDRAVAQVGALRRILNGAKR